MAPHVPHRIRRCRAARAGACDLRPRRARSRRRVSLSPRPALRSRVSRYDADELALAAGRLHGALRRRRQSAAHRPDPSGRDRSRPRLRRRHGPAAGGPPRRAARTRHRRRHDAGDARGRHASGRTRPAWVRSSTIRAGLLRTTAGRRRKRRRRDFEWRCQPLRPTSRRCSPRSIGCCVRADGCISPTSWSSAN